MMIFFFKILLPSHSFFPCKKQTIIENECITKQIQHFLDSIFLRNIFLFLSFNLFKKKNKMSTVTSQYAS